jgi:chromosome segregation ATPase
VVEELRAELTKAQEENKESSKVVEELRAEFTKAQEEDKELSKVVEELRAELTKAQEEDKESSKVAEELQAKLAKVQEDSRESSKLIEELQAKIDKAEEQVKESSNLVAELQAQVNRDQETIAKLTTAAEDASKAIESGSKEANLGQLPASDPHELAMLKEQLDGALQEVETQRALNEKAEETIEQSKIKIRELDASLKVTQAELTEAKAAHANGVDLPKTPTGKASENGSPGLGDSKWATADTITSSETDGDERGAGIQGRVSPCQPRTDLACVLCTLIL